MSAKACTCETPNETCQRAGLPMIGRLWQLCRGVNCTVEQSERSRLAWDRQGAMNTNRPCVYLEPATGRQELCGTCNGNVRIKVFGCKAHGNCTLEKAVQGIQCCTICPDYEPKQPSLQILLTGGIGDIFALEGMMTPEEREQLDTIYYSAPAGQEICRLFQALPNYQRLKSHIILPVRRTAPGDVEDWSVGRIFPKSLPYLGSSFLIHRLTVVRKPSVPYVAIVPHSSWGRWEDRDFSEADWKACLEFLEKHNLIGVVLGKEKWPIPDSSRLLDKQGQTNILESTELLKGAQGYLGIDSCWCVLAAKLFAANRLAVKSVWQHCYNLAETYFAPRKEFGFLRRKLEAPTWN